MTSAEQNQHPHFRMGVLFVGQNWYSYCSNNPLVMVDPTGMGGEEADPTASVVPAVEQDSTTEGDNTVYQTDPKLEPQGEDNACYYLAIVRIAEIEVGKSLTADEINEMTTQLIKDGDLLMTVDGKPDSYYVKGRDEVLNAAFKKLGSSKTGSVSTGLQVGRPSGHSDYTLVSGTHISGGELFNHTQTGDALGNILRDPYRPRPFIMENKKYREVFINDN